MRAETPLRVDSRDAVDWHDSADVVVVGFGGAGACAAIAARERDARVIIVERFDGGGATALSGGVYYGGATEYQRQAGYDDTPENMFNYLQLEVDGAVSEATLRRFCEQSAANLQWLVAQGAKFDGAVAPDDAAYMAAGYHLYFSGNERAPGCATRARPAPRGHIAVGAGGGSAGQYLFAALERSALRAGVKLYAHAPMTRLVLDADDRIVGIEIVELPEGSRLRRAHERYVRLFNQGKGILYGPPARFLQRRLQKLERAGTRKLIGARRGVVLATGGFIHNPEMVKRYLPRHVRAVTLGSAGCTGAGILAALAAGAQAGRMTSVDSSRSLLVPKTFAKGMLVNIEGVRFIAEDAYSAAIGREIIERQDGKAWLILDCELFKASWAAVAPWRKMLIRYRLRALMPLLLAWCGGLTVDALARACAIPADALRSSVDAYNEGVRSGRDALGKLAANLRPIGRGPYFAIDCATDSAGFPPTSFTLGGLAVEENTGQVLGASGAPMQGLYAAGRAAVGVASNFYVSGLSIADCVFSGRRAGRSAATAEPLSAKRDELA